MGLENNNPGPYLFVSMQRILKQDVDIITPDRIKIAGLGVDFRFMSIPGCFPLSFDGETIWCTNGTIHPIIHSALKSTNMVDFRYYKPKNLLTAWIYDGKDMRDVFADFYRAYKAGNVENILRCRDKKRVFLPDMDIDKVNVIFIETIDGKEYVTICRFCEIGGTGSIEANDWYRKFHIAPPSLKKMLPDYDKWKHQYYLEGVRAWIGKYGDIDPAHYHLIMYGE